MNTQVALSAKYSKLLNEDRIAYKVKENSEFVKDFSKYIDVFRKMQNKALSDLEEENSF